MDHNQKLSYARMFAEGRHPEASIQKIAAFSGAVVYLMTGASGGYGGPSVREHAVNYAAIESGRPGAITLLMRLVSSRIRLSLGL